MVYFVRRLDGLIKIGYTSNVQGRMQQLFREFRPLDLLLVLYGSMRTEKAHHRHFAALRATGEWFTPGEDLLTYISAMPSQDPAGPVCLVTSVTRRTLGDTISREWPAQRVLVLDHSANDV